MSVRLDLLLHYGREGESFSRMAQRLHLIKSTVHRLWHQHSTPADRKRREVVRNQRRDQRIAEQKEREAMARLRRQRAQQAANPQPEPAIVEPLFSDDPRASLPDWGRLPSRPETIVPRRGNVA